MLDHHARPAHPRTPAYAGGQTSARWPHRRILGAGEAVVAVAGAVGAVMLLADRFTPPIAAIAPLGLSTWTLPGLWLAATVPVPAGAAAVLVWRRSERAPEVAVVAAATMAVEVLVQIPFLGPSPLQAVFGGTAVVLAALARHARRAGWGVVGGDGRAPRSAQAPGTSPTTSSYPRASGRSAGA